MKAGLVGLFVVLLLLLPQSGARAATTASAPKPLCPPFPKVQKRDPNAPTKRIVIFFDGTWNGVDLSIQTNVHRLYSSVCARQIEPGNEGKILAWYDPGVGSDFRKLTGGAFGYGFSKNVRDGYEFLSRYFNPGDQIYVFGFSRGAFTARTFAAMVQQVGVLNRDAYFTKKGGGLDESDFRNDYEELFKTVKQVGQEESERCGEPFWTWNDIWWRKTSSGALAQLDEGRAEAVPGTPARLRTEIEVVGVWDTVAALGRTHGVPEPKYLVTISDLPAVRAHTRRWPSTSHGRTSAPSFGVLTANRSARKPLCPVVPIGFELTLKLSTRRGSLARTPMLGVAIKLLPARTWRTSHWHG